MQRRAFVLAPALAALTSGLSIASAKTRKPSTTTPTTTTPTTTTPTTTTPTTTAPAPTTGLNVVGEIKSLRIPTGPFAGAYEIAPNGRINWYFSALGLLPIVQHLGSADLDLYVRTYLDVYLANLNANFSIDDVDLPYGRANTSIYTKVLSDSDDSYAATLLSLATRYLRASNNWTWWDANKAKLKNVAYYNLARALKSNGLTNTFQAPRSSTWPVAYLMDNCEVYRGLRDFAGILRDRGDSEAAYYDNLATSISGGIVKLFRTTQAAFIVSDASTAPETSFYAGTTCQVFPQAFGVTEAAPLFDHAWNWLNKSTPNWQDGRYDPYPWAVLGFVAAKRGLFTQAQAQLATIEQKFAATRAQVTINELGFYQRTRNVLAGGADV
jgi:hypothetical protein